MDQSMSISLLIMGITVAISVLAMQKSSWMSAMTMNPYRISKKREYWRFITSGFIHADFTHLFFNLFSFYFFGGQLEYIFNMIFPGYGVAMFVLFYLSAIVAADLPTYFKQQKNLFLVNKNG